MFDQNWRLYNLVISSLTLLKVKRVVFFASSGISIIFAFTLLQPTIAKAAGATLSATPSSRTVNAGQTAAYTININRDRYTEKITLNASNLPAGVTASFSPNPTTGKSSVLTVTTKTTALAGTYKLKISGSAPGINIAPISVNLIVKPVPGVSLSIIPGTLSIIAGQSAAVKVNIDRANYEGPVFLEAENLPEGFSVKFDENPSYGLNTNMRIYSPMPPYPYPWTDHIIKIRAHLMELEDVVVQFRFKVNCAIDWVDQFGAVTADEVILNGTGDSYQSVAVDDTGNSYVVGDVFIPGFASEVWVAKYNKFGQKQWFKTFGTPGEFEDRVLDVVVDSSGNIFLGGYTNGTFPNNGNFGGFDFWIAKYDSAGNQVWIEQGGGLAEDGASGFEIVPDGSGGGKFTTFENDRRNVVTYTFNGNGSLSLSNNFQIPSLFRNHLGGITLGPNNMVVIVGGYINGPAQNAYLLKYDNQSGNLLYQDTFFVEESTVARRAVIDNAGKIYVAGTSQDLNGPDLSINAWVRIYDPNNQFVEKSIKSAGEDDLINALTIDQNGDLIVAGKTKGVLGEMGGGGEDAWMARLDSTTADLVWIRQFPVSQDDSFEAVAIDGDGIILAGHTRDFVSPNGSRDALLMRYQATSQIFPPIITGFSSPATGQPITGAQVGNTIRLNGNFGFAEFSAITNVRFNGVPASFTHINRIVIDAVVPQGATSGYVTVTKDCECMRSPMQLTIVP